MYTNTDNSILAKSKFDEILTRISLSNPDICSFVEVKPKNGSPPAEENLQIQGYDLFTNDLSSKETRGVITYVKSELKAVQIKSDATSKFPDCVWVSIGDVAKKPLLIGNIYRSGTPEKAKKLDDNMHAMIKSLALDKKFSEIVITGDFNHKDITWNPETEIPRPANHPDTLFKDCLHDSYLHQLVNQHTRIRGIQKSLLDLILTNDETAIEKIEYNSHIGDSDHLTLNFTYNSNCLVKETIANSTKLSYNYSKTNKAKMTEMLTRDWKEELVNKSPDEAYNHFVCLYKKAVSSCVPVYKPKQKDKDKKPKPEWMKPKTLHLVTNKHHLWTRYLHTKHQSDFMKYTEARNKVTRAILKDRKTFEKLIAKEMKQNMKIFWKYVNRHKKNKPKIPDLINKDGTYSKSDEDKANTLNKQFTSVFSYEDIDELPLLPDQHIIESLSSIEITQQAVLKKLKNLRTDKACGSDTVHPYILKNFADIVVAPLTIIFNKSLETGELPKIWKSALITPLYKKGPKHKPENYRPISLTSVPCKIMESIFIDHIVDHIQINNLSNPYQHGFTKKRSPDTNLLQALNIWSDALSHHIPIDIVYLDYEKAFDKVPHERLVMQLEKYGITSKPLKWIRNFLTNRTQRVSINGTTSESAPVTSGVPQGSVLGPVLFLIYISGVTSLVQNFISLFADDSKLFSKILDDASIDTLQQDIQALSEWSEKMLMKFNVNKCHVLHLGSNNPEHYYYMPNSSHLTYPTLQPVEDEKDLGVIVDSKLNFHKHMNAKISKANKMLGIVRRTFKHMNSDIFKICYKSIIRPHLEYGSIIWSPHTKEYQDKVEKLQRRATKIVPALFELPYCERLKKLKIPTLSYRRLRAALLFLYKYHHDLVDINLDTHCNICRSSNPLEPSLSHSTRGHNMKIRIQRHQGIRQRLFFTKTIPIWNTLRDTPVNA